MKKYLYVLAALIPIGLIAAFAPGLISSKDDVSALFGATLILAIPLALLFGKKILQAGKILPLLLLVGLAPMFGGCSYNPVPAGQVLVVINKYGSEKGVDNTEVRGPGKYWLSWNQEGHLFPTFTQNYTWTKDAIDGDNTDESISFQSNKGMVINADVGISYYIKEEMAGVVFSKYRKGVEELTDIVLRNLVRDSLVNHASSMTVEDIYGEAKVKLLTAVEEDVRRKVEKYGIVIEDLSWIGPARLPEVVTKALNASVEATQLAIQRQNEVAATMAEAQKAEEKAKGEAKAITALAAAQAEANTILAKSITPELVKYRALERWDGILPKMTGSSAIPFIDVTKDSQ